MFLIRPVWAVGGRLLFRDRHVTGFELAGQRAYIGVTIQAAGCPIVDGASTVLRDDDLTGATRRYSGVCIKPRPTRGLGLVLGWHHAWTPTLPHWLVGPRGDGGLLPRAAAPRVAADDVSHALAAYATANQWAQTPDELNTPHPFTAGFGTSVCSTCGHTWSTPAHLDSLGRPL